MATEQEEFWRGDFGDEYSRRNEGAEWVASNTALFARILQSVTRVSTVLEMGANIGLNLRALSHLLPAAAFTAIEINASAADALRKNLPAVEVHETSVFDFEPSQRWDLVFTKGVLIHVNPEKLPAVYDLMYRCAERYVLVVEYFNPSPVAIKYRGHDARLFKRDFAGEMLDRFPQLRLVNYGFVYRRDPNFPQDDTHWFLMEKQ